MTGLLRVEQLAVDFVDAGQTVAAVRNASFSLAPGGRLALLGESGSGKTVSMMALAGLLPDNAVQVKVGDKTVTL